MAFERGHTKLGGRRVGTQNRSSGAAREVAQRLLADPEYQQSLMKRLRQGMAPRLELYLWVGLREAPRGARRSARGSRRERGLGPDPGEARRTDAEDTEPQFPPVRIARH